MLTDAYMHGLSPIRDMLVCEDCLHEHSDNGVHVYHRLCANCLPHYDVINFVKEKELAHLAC